MPNNEKSMTVELLKKWVTQNETEYLINYEHLPQSYLKFNKVN